MTHLYQEYKELVSIHVYTGFRQQLLGSEEVATYKRLITGHTHRQAVRYLADDLLWINPGSASYRRRDDPDQSAHYAVIVDGVISLRRLAYDLTPVRTAVAQVALKATEVKVAQRFFA